MRILGIDFGKKRVGVALSDPTETIASPVTTLERRTGQRMPLKALENLSREHEVGRIVVGLPLSSAGAENEWCAEVRQAGDALAKRLDLPVEYQDERMSTARAERTMQILGLPRSKRRERGRVDAIAAAIILQTYLDRVKVGST